MISVPVDRLLEAVLRHDTVFRGDDLGLQAQDSRRTEP